MLFYNTVPAGPPDASLDFFDTLASSYQLLGGTTEEVGFNAQNPLQLYLEVPGIPGEASTPGHPNVMQIQSWSLVFNDFTIIKQQDTASDDLLLANAQGTHFAEARLLLYDSLPLGSSPDAVIEFEDLLISSSQLGGPGQPEQHTFNFASLSQVQSPAHSRSALLLPCAQHTQRGADEQNQLLCFRLRLLCFRSRKPGSRSRRAAKTCLAFRCMLVILSIIYA
jgi:type VI protein secretion system component Hcp